MPDERKQKLVKLGPEALADMLLDLATKIEQVDDRINREFAPATENVKNIRKKIQALTTRTGFINYMYIDDFASQLEGLLEDLESVVTDPSTGLDLVAEFFETDSFVFNYSDDEGVIGDVYLGQAKELFFSYASACPDMEKAASLAIQLYINSEYGARDSLMEHIMDSFGKPGVAILQKKLEVLQAGEQDAKKKRSYTSLLGSVTKQIKEAQLFEDALAGKDVNLATTAILKVSQTLLERNEIEVAHRWIKKIPQDNISNSYEIEKILKEIYARKGDNESLIALHYNNFKTYRTLDGWKELLEVIGKERGEELLAQEVALICTGPGFDTDNAQFLADVGKIDELEAYLFARVEKLDGGAYYSLPDIAKALADHQRYLAACLIYRALLASMMERAYAKSYHHGVDYLHAMDGFAPLIKDWKGYPTHNAFKVRLLQENKRKTSFWNQYVK